LIHICIPVHDEERTIGVLLWKIRRIMREFGRDYRVLVRDDASTDATADVLARYRTVVPLDVERVERREGYGASLEVLIRKAVDMSTYPKRDTIVTLQGDFSEDPNSIVTMVKAIEGGADLVCGVSEATEASPRSVRLTRWAASRLLRKTLESAPVADPLCGLRTYRVIVLKKALREIADGRLVSHEGLVANLELLHTAAPHARRIVEIPVTLRYDIRSRPSRLRTFATLRGLSRVRRTTWEATEEDAA
jgi:glycosyltransferase involved in cell wall biosynthesis